MPLINSFIQDIYIELLQVHFYSEALPTQHGYCAVVSRRSATGNCELRTCPGSLFGGYSGIGTHDLRLYQCATTSHIFVSCSSFIYFPCPLSLQRLTNTAR